MPLFSIQIAFIITKGLKTNFKPDKIPFLKSSSMIFYCKKYLKLFFFFFQNINFKLKISISW
ncbi:hypothetical protein [Helicobacter pylori]|uniref:hypothetical protein n=1 Tax=Helicobacter pylori TaxID=210 RepID=UPI001FBA1CC6|nr:hypothetical protein [Helicobacter pylori]